MQKRRSLAAFASLLVMLKAPTANSDAMYRPRNLPAACDDPYCFVKTDDVSEDDLAFCCCGDMGPIIASRIDEGAFGTINSVAGENLLNAETDLEDNGWHSLTARAYLDAFNRVNNANGTEWLTVKRAGQSSLMVAELGTWEAGAFQGKFADPIAVADEEGFVDPQTKIDIPKDLSDLTHDESGFPYDGTAKGSGDTNENSIGVETLASAAFWFACLGITMPCSF